MLPAHFDGIPFHVEAAARESGRRIALHEFPKKEYPYAEDMGHTAVAFTVRGYIIVYPNGENDNGTLYQRDYRNCRDRLIARLDLGSPGVLQLPSFVKKITPMIVVCPKYRVTEEDRTGGYCVFDMQFVERGVRPFSERGDAQGNLFAQSHALRQQVWERWLIERDTGQKQTMGTFNALVRTGQKQVMGPFNPLQRFVGPPKKMGPIKPVKTGPASEFERLTGSTAVLHRPIRPGTSSPPSEF